MNAQHLSSIFTPEQVRQATPDERARMIRILALAQETGAPIELARQAVDLADQEVKRDDHA